MSKPEWLKDVQELAVTQAHAQGRSETGAAMAAIADALQGNGQEPFATGEVMGVVIARAAGAQYAVAVSTGDAQADVARLAQLHGADVASISLMPAAAMLIEQHQGVALCSGLPKEPVDVVDNRVTVDMLEYLLAKRKAEGLPGSTVVALAGLDNNGRSGVANFEVRPHMAAVAKAEFEKNWTIAKFVTRGGVPVLVLS